MADPNFNLKLWRCPELTPAFPQQLVLCRAPLHQQLQPLCNPAVNRALGHYAPPCTAGPCLAMLHALRNYTSLRARAAEEDGKQASRPALRLRRRNSPRGSRATHAQARGSPLRGCRGGARGRRGWALGLGVCTREEEVPPSRAFFTLRREKTLSRPLPAAV